MLASQESSDAASTVQPVRAHRRSPRARRGAPEPPLILVVSKDRAEAIPKLRELLQGDPEISIIVDRRVAERRTNDLEIEVEPIEDALAERRGQDRRRPCSCYLL
jgi:hypothetical protein